MLYDTADATTPGPGCLRRMTRRFCQKDYNGGADDPGLRPLIERLAKGEHYADFLPHEKQPLAKWLSAFRHVSCLHVRCWVAGGAGLPNFTS